MTKDDIIGMVAMKEKVEEELKARGYESINEKDIDRVLSFIDFDDFSKDLESQCSQFAFWTIANACAAAGYLHKSLKDGEISWIDIAAQK